jgi:hypothetical protein
VSEDATLHSLADFQREAVGALQSAIVRVAEHIEDRPDQRREIALRSGAALLEAPTGSGKTLMLGRTVEGLVGNLPSKTVWFWFAPFSGLVSQTRNSLSEQCPGLRLRELASDRSVAGVRDGDVFVQTWSAVAANNKEARKVRRESESELSLDQMITSLRAMDFAVGVVIDEAHLNFGASANAAAKFYLEALQPDFTLLATATPNDSKLEAFEAAADVAVANRVVIPRQRVVDAGLNKRGLMLGYLTMSPGDEALIDYEQAILQCAWTQHREISERLSDCGIGVVPLMLVQVEDQTAGGGDPVARVREKLLELPGVTESIIATHTSGEPDADFHMLAYDHSKQILIFKVAVATGFDAPRAWTLVSVRPNRGEAFGLQIVGRIMRVHPLVRPLHGADDLLDRGYVFLTDPEMQAGLNAAAEELKAVRQSLTVISDQLDVIEYGTTSSTSLQLSDVHRAPPTSPSPPNDQSERQERLDLLIQQGIVNPDVAEMDGSAIDRAIVEGETVRAISQTSLFANLPEHDAPKKSKSVPKLTAYALRKELGVPSALWQEHPLDHTQLNDPSFLKDVATAFCDNSKLVGQLHQVQRKASLSLRDLFLDGESREVSLSLRMSNARIAEKAQLAFQLNDSIDPRLLERALIEALRLRADDGGYLAEKADLRRTIQLAAMREPEALLAAIKKEQGARCRLENKEPIADPLFDREDAETAQKGAHGIFPNGMNKPEREFAEMLDEDDTGTVLWWLRNPENVGWATRMILPTGGRFFPDFAVGIKGRTTPDCIALVEIKDDGVDGRLHSDKNLLKIQVQHREYRNVFWTYKGSGGFERLQYNDALKRIQPIDLFQISQMVLVS